MLSRHWLAVTVAVALLLCASAAFAVMAANSPRTWPNCVTRPTGTGGGGDKAMSYTVTAPLDAVIPSCASVAPEYTARIWTYQSYAEIAEGLVVLALLLPIITAKRLDSSWLHKPLASWFPLWLLVPLALVGASFFALFPMVSALWAGYENAPFYVELRADVLSTGLTVGVGAVTVWCLTMLIVSLRKGIVGAVKWFGLPAVVYLGCMVFLFDRGEMTLHVTGFATWFYSGFWVLSNWSVTVVASGLILLSLSSRLNLRRSRTKLA